MGNYVMGQGSDFGTKQWIRKERHRRGRSSGKRLIAWIVSLAMVFSAFAIFPGAAYGADAAPASGKTESGKQGVSPQEVVEQFSFKVTVDDGDLTFKIPLNRPVTTRYDWDIDWGDGSSENLTQEDFPCGSVSAGIPHSYMVSGSGTYTITIAPADSLDAWFSAFGFGEQNSDSQNPDASKVTELISPITPLMTRTEADLENQTSPNDEWAYAFQYCTNLTMGDVFTFNQEAWAGKTSAGENFANSMFDGCSGDTFQMGKTFNLPQSFTEAGDGFATQMFSECRGTDFTMNDVFTLPQSLIKVGSDFASNMFYDCAGASFTMGENFNLPQKLTTVGDIFAADMFRGCSGDAFTMSKDFNLPQSLTSAGGNFVSGIFSDCAGDAFTMSADFNLPQGLTSVGDYFASGMFSGCEGDAFTMSEDFNLPQGLTSVGEYFAASMFYLAGGPVFYINNVFMFPVLSSTYIDDYDAFSSTFGKLQNAPMQTRTGYIGFNPIMNGNTAVGSSYAFEDGSSFFPDWEYIPGNFGGNDGGPLSKISFDNGGHGRTLHDVIVPTNTKVTGVVPELTETGQAFGGWYTDVDRKVEWNPEVFITEDITLYAKWTVDEDDDNQPRDYVDPTGDIKVKSVTVSGAPAVYQYDANLIVNTVQLRAVALPQNAKNKVVTWKSSNPGVALVDANGKVTVLGREGTVRITASAKDGSRQSGYKDISVVKHITKIRTPQKTVYLKKGKSLTLPIAMDDGILTVKGQRMFQSSKPAVVAVTAKGKVTAKKKGTSVITVTAKNGKSLKIKVNVVKKAVKLKRAKLKGIPKKIQAGKIKQLKIKVTKKAANLKITYKSSNKKVLSVDAAGKITGLKEGKARITVKIGKKKIRTRKIQVMAPVSQIKATKTKLTLKKGKSVNLKSKLKVKAYQKTPFMKKPQLTVAPVKAKLKWSSSKKRVVSVSKSGKIKALRKGTARITAKALNGKKIRFTVTVK